MGRFGVVVFLALSACTIHSDLVICGDGRACPVGTTCNNAAETCVTDEQIAACGTLTDGELCTLPSGPGTCVGGACFEPRCGDRIVETGEVCDDGNLVPGDGCAADCSTVEGCGNGVLEANLGEDCDDGNLLSGDGCDSRCASEQMSWRVLECGVPRRVGYLNSAFDEKRGVLVHIDNPWLWEWDGTQWSCLYVGKVPLRALIYDPVRERVLAFEDFQIRAWDGAAWTVASSAATPYFNTYAYDSTLDRFFTWSRFAPNTVTWFDRGTLAQTTVTPASGPPADGWAGAVYDPPSNRIVAVIGLDGSPTTAVQTWLYNPTTNNWANVSSSWAPKRGVAITYHKGLQKVVAFGGWDGVSPISTLHTWNGATWDVMPATSSVPNLAREGHTLVYDPASASLLAPGGGASPDVVRYSTAWTRWTPTGLIPDNISTLVAFPPQRTMVAISDDGKTWVRTASGWSVANLQYSAPRFATYHPGSQHLVGYESSGRFAEFDGTDWSNPAPDAVPVAQGPLAYDPTRDALVLVSDRTYVRAAAGWQQLNMTSLGKSLAFDQRNGRLALLRETGGSTTSVLHLIANGWREEFAFPSAMFSSSSYAAITFSHRGTAAYVHLNTGDVWENATDIWRKFTGPTPAPAYVAGYDVMRGEIVLVTRDGTELAISFTSGAPRESCVAGEDADGDGASDCADDDCWWACAPTCPPASTCF